VKGGEDDIFPTLLVTEVREGDLEDIDEAGDVGLELRADVVFILVFDCADDAYSCQPLPLSPRGKKCYHNPCNYIISAMFLKGGWKDRLNNDIDSPPPLLRGVPSLFDRRPVSNIADQTLTPLVPPVHTRLLRGNVPANGGNAVAACECNSTDTPPQVPGRAKYHPYLLGWGALWRRGLTGGRKLGRRD
jgi:hypothetical protein